MRPVQFLIQDCHSPTPVGADTVQEPLLHDDSSPAIRGIDERAFVALLVAVWIDDAVAASGTNTHAGVAHADRLARVAAACAIRI